MASILDKYGIKEVADVVFYELDNNGAPSAPVLYLDTLKVSTIEQSAEVVDATGGKGNVKLISWDTNKEVTATFEDALFSVKSLAIMFGGTVNDNGDSQEVLKTVMSDKLTSVEGTQDEHAPNDSWEFVLNSTNKVVILKKNCTYFKYDGDKIKPVAHSGFTPITSITTADFDFMTCDLLDCSDGKVSGLTITIDASTFGGTYYITGDTYARNYQSGKDEFLQFIIPKGKVSSEDLSLTMEADGDPATFSMNVNVLKAADGSMFKLVKYNLGAGGTDTAENMGVATVLDPYATTYVAADYTTNPEASKKEGIPATNNSNAGGGGSGDNTGGDPQNADPADPQTP